MSYANYLLIKDFFCVVEKLKADTVAVLSYENDSVCLPAIGILRTVFSYGNHLLIRFVSVPGNIRSILNYEDHLIKKAETVPFLAMKTT